jgi:limonene 1,2-monooxygenase
MTRPWPLKFGIFLAPFHPVGQNPTLALERDLDLIVHLDKLGFDEAWIGEHHSAGYEIIASPEVFIATAAERTRNIRFGTGVSSLPYHHPLMLADRMVLLDHLTRGRVMMGVGPGSLPSDAFMMGIEVAKQRDRMEEALEAILLLLRSDEPVSIETEWFTLSDARLNLRPYSTPHFEVAVASQVSPTGARAAGRFGVSLLSIGATNTQGFDMLGYNWGIAEQRAADFDTTMDRQAWRLVGPMHIADTKEQAYRDVDFGLAEWIDYFQRDAINAAGFAVIGTVEDAIAQIQRLWDQSGGGFGTFLQMATDWADTDATRHSYELMARYVFPEFQGSAESTTTSRDWAAENRPKFIGEVGAAIMSSIARHNEEQEAKTAAK